MAAKGATLAACGLALVAALPVVLGFVATLPLAFGYFPAIGLDGASIDPLLQVLAIRDLATSIALSLWTGGAASALSLVLALVLLGRLRHRRLGLLAPILAMPHAAIAIGLAFLIAPSGWLVRLISPWPTGWDKPPDVALVHDPFGLALILALVIKETPFLVFVGLATLPRLALPPEAARRAGAGLGLAPARAFAELIVPQLLRALRLPFAVVLAYGVTVSDVALILGPQNPPTVAVLTLRLQQSPNLADLPAAAVLALVQVALVAASLAVAFGLKRLGQTASAERVLTRGVRPEPRRGPKYAGRIVTSLIIALAIGSIGVLVLWSLAASWIFPARLPAGFTLSAWQLTGATGDSLANTLTLALLASGLGVILALILLEIASRWQLDLMGGPAAALVLLALILPQSAHIFGLNALGLRLGLSGSQTLVLLGHLGQTLPYALVVLSGAWQSLDMRLLKVGSALGLGANARFLRLKLPLLTTPILSALAIGISVSVAQYLATLVLGAGRVPTLTSEAVALSSGSNRRLLAVHALLQAALPVLAFLLAGLLPLLIWKNRAGMAVRR